MQVFLYDETSIRIFQTHRHIGHIVGRWDSAVDRGSGFIPNRFKLRAQDKPSHRDEILVNNIEDESKKSRRDRILVNNIQAGLKKSHRDGISVPVE